MRFALLFLNSTNSRQLFRAPFRGIYFGLSIIVFMQTHEPSSKQILKRQLELLNKPTKTIKKREEHRTATERLQKVQQAKQSEVQERNLQYLRRSKNHKHLDKQVKNVAKRTRGKKQKTTKQVVPVGQRVLGPGFLERYGKSKE